MGRPSLQPGLRVLGRRVLLAALVGATLLWGAVTVGHAHLGSLSSPTVSPPAASDAVPNRCPLCRLALETVSPTDPGTSVPRVGSSRLPAERLASDAVAATEAGTRTPRAPPGALSS